ncbi:MAG: ABC transporter substrate-binding protein [bacterium]|nr:ABC transporter substrate-binding protein [bacterium]
MFPLLVALAIFMAVGLTGCGGGGGDRPDFALVYKEPHPVINAIVDAFRQKVREEMPNAVVTTHHAQGSDAEIRVAVRTALDQNPRVLVPITTPVSIEAARQVRAKAAQDPETPPLVFLGVTDPVGAGLVEAFAAGGEFCTGVSDNPPMDRVVGLAKELLPDLRSMGMLYDPRDQPAVVSAERVRAACKAQGVTLELKKVSSESEIRAATRALCGAVDALVIGMDNLMMKNAGLIARTASPLGKPLFAADSEAVSMGAVAGVGVDYRDVGRLGAELAISITRDGRVPSELPVRQLSTGSLHYNDTALRALGIASPESKSAAPAKRK